MFTEEVWKDIDDKLVSSQERLEGRRTAFRNS